MHPEKAGVVGGAVGATIGATAWLIVLGIMLRSPLLALLPVAWGTLCIVGVLRFYDRHPERKLAIFGLGLAWLVALNLLLVNPLYAHIPDTVAGMTTGKDQVSLPAVNAVLGLCALSGLGMAGWDYVRARNRRGADPNP